MSVSPQKADEIVQAFSRLNSAPNNSEYKKNAYSYSLKELEGTLVQRAGRDDGAPFKVAIEQRIEEIKGRSVHVRDAVFLMIGASLSKAIDWLFPF